jgi:small-conductance mechanosensitive channel
MRLAVTVCIIAIYLLIIKYIFKGLLKAKKSITLTYLKSILQIVGVFIIVFGYLSLFHQTQELSKTLLQSGGLIIAVATFACQKVLGNVVSGFVISVTKPFEIGEKIQLRSTSGDVAVEGIVIDMTVRHIVVRQSDGKCCLIPNSVVDELIVVNNHTLENNGYPLYMFCSFNSDVDKAIEVMQRVINEHELTILTDEPRNKVMCSEVADDGFKLQALIWTKTLSDNFRACADLRIQIYKAWKEAGIEIPYKTITIDKQM